VINEKNQQQHTILIIDDDAFNRDVIEDNLTSVGYETVHAEDGEHAWEILLSQQYSFSTILLDRQMPRLDGMGFLERIKKDSQYTHVPVIFQTSVDDAQSIIEAIQAGVYYYLTKPFNKEVLLDIIESSIEAYKMMSHHSADDSQEQAQVFNMLEFAEFKFQTIQEGRVLASKLADVYPDYKDLNLGLTELFINAVEHGNLGIGYQDKSELIRTHRWHEEIDKREKLPENRNKFVKVVVQHSKENVSFQIIDDGMGFDWQNYLEISPDRVFDLHGRGIAMSSKISFDSIEYKGKGNEVVVTKHFVY